MTSRRFQSILMSFVRLNRETSKQYPEYRNKCERAVQMAIQKIEDFFVLTSRTILVYLLIVTWFKIGP